MSGVTRTNVHGWAAIGWSLLPLAIAGYVAAIARHADFRAPPALGYGLAALFAAAGLFLLTHGIAGLRRDARRETRMELRPDQPWLADHPWNPDGIDDSPWQLAIRAFWGPFLLALFAVPAHWIGYHRDPYFFIGAILLDIVFAYALFRAVRLLVRAIRFGPSRLEFERFPFRPDELLRARYRGPGSMGKVIAKLRYVIEREETVGKGSHSWTRMRCEEVWAETAVVRGGRIRFHLPPDAQATALSARPARYWELEIKAGEYETRFFLPVYGRETADAQPVRRAAAAPRE